MIFTFMDSATIASMKDDRTIETVGYINHIWLNLLADEHQRQAVALRYLSHLWDFCPGWYLWLKNRPGVYKMELQAAQASEEYAWLAELVIKYCPSVDEESFNELSFREKIYRQSEIFERMPAEGISDCLPCYGHCEQYDEDRLSDLKEGTGAPASRYAGRRTDDFFSSGHLGLACRTESVSFIPEE